MYRLVFLNGPRQGRRVAVQQGDVLIGRDEDCSLQLGHPSVCPRHALLERRPEGFFIRALDPSGRLSVNDRDTVEQRLMHGDEIDVGAERLLFQLSDPDPVSAKRRVGKFHGLTFLAIFIILLLQVVIVAGLILFWRMDPIETQSAPAGLTAAGQADRADELAILQEREQALRTVAGSRAAPRGGDGFRLLPLWFVTPVYPPPGRPGVALDERGPADRFPAQEE
jgi:hypothetical protein